jgi:TPR repeat protein
LPPLNNLLEVFLKVNKTFFSNLNSAVSSYISINVDNEVFFSCEDSTKFKVINIACCSFFNREPSFNFDNIKLRLKVNWLSLNKTEDLEAKVNKLSKVLSKSLKNLKEKIKEYESVNNLESDIINSLKEMLTREFLVEKAGQGDKDAQYEYACMCYEGRGGAKDFFVAKEYFKLAAGQGCTESKFQYALMCLDGLPEGKELFVARKCFKEVADQGYINAGYNYYLLCDLDLLETEELKEANEYLRKAADHGLARAQYKYGKLSIEKSVEAGLKKETASHDFLFRKTADEIEVIIKDLKKEKAEHRSVAYSNFHKAADQGHKEAQYEAAEILYEDGKYSEAREYYKLAADQGHVKDMFDYGMMCRCGKGGVVDSESASEYCKKARNQGYSLEMLACVRGKKKRYEL